MLFLDVCLINYLGFIIIIVIIIIKITNASKIQSCWGTLTLINFAFLSVFHDSSLGCHLHPCKHNIPNGSEEFFNRWYELYRVLELHYTSFSREVLQCFQADPLVLQSRPVGTGVVLWTSLQSHI